MSVTVLETAKARPRRAYQRERDARFVRKCEDAFRGATLDPQLEGLSQGAACQVALDACENGTAKAALWLAARGIMTSRQYVNYVKSGQFKGGKTRPTLNAWLPEDGIVDEIAVDIAAQGTRLVALTLAEARMAAGIMRGRMIDVQVIAERLGVTDGCVRAWTAEGYLTAGMAA